MLDPGLARLWARIQEPKVVTLYQFGIYIIIALTGLAAWFTPPTSLEGAIGPILTKMVAVFLIAGGTLGASVVLPGVWWIERAAVLASFTGAAIYCGVSLRLQFTEPVPRLIIVGVTLWAMLSIAQRWHRIRRYPYDPEKR